MVKINEIRLTNFRENGLRTFEKFVNETEAKRTNKNKINKLIN